MSVHSSRYLAKCLVKQLGARVLARAKNSVSRLKSLQTALYFEFLQKQAAAGDSTAQEALAAAILAASKVKSARDLLFCGWEVCTEFRALREVRESLRKYGTLMHELVSANGVVHQDTVDDAVSLATLLATQHDPAWLTTKWLADHDDGLTLYGLLNGLVAQFPKPIVTAPVEPFVVRHAPMDWHRVTSLVNVARGVHSGHPLFVSPNVAEQGSEEQRQAARLRVLNSVFSAAEVGRITQHGGSAVSFTTDGLTLNAKVQRLVPSALAKATAQADYAREFGDGVGIFKGQATSRVSASTRRVLQQLPLAAVPFDELGAKVYSMCRDGKFSSLPSDVRWLIGDLTLAAVGVDPYYSGMYREVDLKLPLLSNGHIVPVSRRLRHRWLLSSLRRHDPRFRRGCDPGVLAAITVTDSDAFASTVHGLYKPNPAVPADPATVQAAAAALPTRPRFSVRAVRLFTKRYNGVRRVAMPSKAFARAVQSGALELVERNCDGRFGFVAVGNAEGLPPGIKPGDMILRLHNSSLLGATPNAALHAWSQVATGVCTQRAVIELKLFRPNPERTSSSEADATVAAAGVTDVTVEADVGGGPGDTSGRADTTGEAPQAASVPLLAPAFVAVDSPVALELSGRAVQESLGILREQECALSEGRSLWPADVIKQKHAELAALDSMLEDPTTSDADRERGRLEFACLMDALAAQQDLVLVVAAGAKIHELLATPDMTMAVVSEALQVAIASAPAVIRNFFRPSRVAALLERKRRAHRLYDKTAHQVTAFISNGLESDTDVVGLVRFPLLVMGDWAVKKKRRHKFAFAQFLACLARTAIVIVASEFRTSKLCSSCGSTVLHPIKRSRHGDEQLDPGTVMCPNRSCQSQHRFLNRDVAGAANIANRFLTSVFGCSQLGTFMWVLFIMVLLYSHLFGCCAGWFSELDTCLNAAGQPALDRRLAFASLFSLEAATADARVECPAPEPPDAALAGWLTAVNAAAAKRKAAAAKAAAAQQAAVSPRMLDDARKGAKAVAATAVDAGWTAESADAQPAAAKARSAKRKAPTPPTEAPTPMTEAPTPTPKRQFV